MCSEKVLKANCVNLWHTCVQGVLRCAESKSVVCQTRKWMLKALTYYGGEETTDHRGVVFLRRRNYNITSEPRWSALRWIVETTRRVSTNHRGG